MSESTERPGPAPDPDAWERACAEDLAAENARRQASGQGPVPGSAAEELRKLVDAVAEKVAAFELPPAAQVAQGAVQQIISQAKAAVEPVIERNPEVFDHLASAGTELLAAYRAAVHRQEARWTRDEPAREPREGREGPGPDGGSERIDLD
ncbi:DUF5304 domain-containing protein [Streptomyces triculaminicus]|uniref:DUF5304 domain-containing protein n=1 Tax=Streptomyces triculaminicus TaxID=2816232 RepID=UPI0037B80CD6